MWGGRFVLGPTEIMEKINVYSSQLNFEMANELKKELQYINIIMDKQKSGISLKTNLKNLPTDEKNIAYKAADLFFTKTGIMGGVKILIHKNISHRRVSE